MKSTIIQIITAPPNMYARYEQDDPDEKFIKIEVVALALVEHEEDDDCD